MKIRSTKLAVALLIGVVLIAATGFVITVFITSNIDHSLLLNGIIVTPDQIIPDGWVLVKGNKIDLVSASKPDVPQAIEVDTGGIIFPGLIDLHNHVSYDVFPSWHPSHLYSNRYEWRNDPAYIQQVSGPYDYLINHDYFCDMNTYGELRALVGGTTSILSTADASCIRGLVRNLDYSSGFYSFADQDSAHIESIINLPSVTDTDAIDSIKLFLTNDSSEMLIIHLSEGVDAASLDEFNTLQQEELLSRKTAIVHGIALTSSEFQIMHTEGASLVWSPRSNIDLYGKTANIPAALDAAVRVALAPDWGLTGSKNMLDELSFAAQWNADHLSNRLTDQQLVDMITITAAEIAGIDDKVGSIRQGLYADLLVISGDLGNPYRSLIDAQPGDVQLMLIGGQPIYGAPEIMGKFWKSTELNEINVDGSTKALRMPSSPISFNEMVSSLQAALATEGTSLAPLAESK